MLALDVSHVATKEHEFGLDCHNKWLYIKIVSQYLPNYVLYVMIPLKLKQTYDLFNKCVFWQIAFKSIFISGEIFNGSDFKTIQKAFIQET